MSAVICLCTCAFTQEKSLTNASTAPRVSLPLAIAMIISADTPTRNPTNAVLAVCATIASTNSWNTAKPVTIVSQASYWGLPKPSHRPSMTIAWFLWIKWWSPTLEAALMYSRTSQKRKAKVATQPAALAVRRKSQLNQPVQPKAGHKTPALHSLRCLKGLEPSPVHLQISVRKLKQLIWMVLSQFWTPTNLSRITLFSTRSRSEIPAEPKTKTCKTSRVSITTLVSWFKSPSRPEKVLYKSASTLFQFF